MPTGSTYSRRILIVDDESTLSFFLKQSLQETGPNCLIDVATSGEDAVNKLTYNRYDLLVTDLKMPGISGFTLVEVARSVQPHIKVILMTAFGTHQVQDEVNELGVDGYLTKPFATLELHNLTQKILSNGRQTSDYTDMQPNS